MYRVTPDTTSKLVEIGLLTIDGDEYTGLAYNTASLACAYLRAGATAWVSVTLADMTLGTWVSGGFKEIGNGMYQFGVPDAALATGADWVVLRFSGASGLETARYLVAIDVATSSRLAPTVAGRTLDIAETGEAGIDLSNIKQATGATTLSNIAFDTDAIPAAAVSTAAVTKIQSGLATSAGGLTAANVWSYATRSLTSGVVRVVNLMQYGAKEVIAGDSYLNADGTNMAVTKDDGASWPADLAGWTIKFSCTPTDETVERVPAAASLEGVLGAVVTAEGDSQSVRWDLTAAQTATLTVGVGAYNYDVQASSGTSRKTLEKGVLTVSAQVTTS